jgi:hypothetical protein
MTKNSSDSIEKTSWIFVLIFLLLSMNTTAFTAEILDGPEAQTELKTKVQTLLDQEKYDELEKMANEFRTTKAQFVGGGWKLVCFYYTFIFSGTTDAQRYESISKLEKWMAKYSHSLTARIATAQAWQCFGWKARGAGWANEVTEEGWKLLRERVEKAYKLVKEKPLAPLSDCPGRYHILLTIARLQGWNREKYDALFQEAVSFEPGYHVYYMEKAWHVTPRWGGAKGEWQEFAEEAVKLMPKSEGMGIYTRILRMLWGSNEFKDFSDPSVSWEKMKQGFLDMERGYPNSLYNLNYFCMFACIAKDRETARTLFKKIGNTPYAWVWKGRSNFEKWRKWAGVN